MSLQTILVEAWTRRLVPSQWLKFTRAFLEQISSSEMADKTRELCDLLIKSLRSSPNPSPILLQYLEEAVGSESLISEAMFLIILSEEYCKTQSFESTQLRALLPMVETALAELNFRMQSLDVDSSVWKALADTSVMLCRIVQKVAGYPPSHLPNHKPEDDNIVVMDIDKPDLDIDMPQLEVANIEGGIDLELAYTSPGESLVPDEEKTPKDISNINHINESNWSLQTVTTEAQVAPVESLIQENAERAASLLNSIYGNEKICPALLKHIMKDSALWDILHTAMLETRIALGTLGDKITKSRSMMSLASCIHRVLDDGGNKGNAAYIQYNNFRIESDGKCIPSSSLYFLVYHLMYRRPVLPDNLVLSRLQKLKRLMGDDQLFYMELWMASLTGMAESCRNKAAVRLQLLWKSFVLVKLPVLIAKLESSPTEKNDAIDTPTSSQSIALEHALRHLSGMKGLLNCCRTSISEESNANEPPILGEIYKVCVERNLIGSDPVFGGVLSDQKLSDGLLSNESVEASAQTILNDPSNENIERLVLTSLAHFERQDIHIDVINKLLVTWTESSQIKPLGFLCQNLIENPQLLDTIVLMQHPKDILTGFERFCNNWGTVSSETRPSGDYESFGYAFILFVTIIERYKLQSELETILQFPTEFSRSWFLKSSTSLFSSTLSSENERIGEWINALFVKKELIEDFICQYSPQDILSLMPLIFEASLDACDAQIMDFDTLVESFKLLLQPAISFSLIGVVLFLCEELTHSRQDPLLVPEVLKALLLNDKFPSHVLRAISERVTVAIGANIEIETQLWKVKEKIMLTVGDIAIAETLHNPGSTFKRFRQAFEAIVLTGRCKFVKSTSWDLSKIHHLDIDLFRNALEFGGPRLFVRTIVQEIVRSSSTKGALRSAELGASLITTLLVNSNKHLLQPANLFTLLLLDVTPNVVLTDLKTYSQGYMFGWFIMLTIVLMEEEVVIPEIHQNVVEIFIVRMLKFIKQYGMTDLNTFQKSLSSHPLSGFFDGMLANREVFVRYPRTKSHFP